jgi:ribosomal protein L37AE/L43A
MTSQIKGFKDDDRSLFTEIIIGIPKIRMYIKKYAKGKESDANLARLDKNLDDLESYVESVNDRITDTARLLRLALIIDDKSPKLYFLPNLDSVDFDDVFINESVNKASGMVLRLTSQTEPNETGSKFQNPYTVSIGTTEPNEPKTTMQRVAHCPHCGNSEMTFLKEQRYRCKPCNKKISLSKVVFK